MTGRKSYRLLVIVMAALGMASVFPILWMAITAVRPASEVFARSFRLLPSTIAWHNLRHAWTTYPVATWIWNSAVITILGAGLTIFLDLLAGYAFAKFSFPAKNTLFFIFLATLMLPTQVFMVPQFMTVAAFHGVNTYWAAFLPRAAETYGVFLARQFLSGIPDELIDAARLEGAGEWRIFWQIVVPLSKPAIAVLSLLLVLGQWNDFGWPLVVLRDARSMTLPVGLNLLQGDRVNDWPGIMFVAFLSILPVTALFMTLQRYFVQGITRTGLK